VKVRFVRRTHRGGLLDRLIQWITGLEAAKRKIGLRMVYDLSATPFFLKGSGYRQGTLFPWVVSGFSLIDAIEAGKTRASWSRFSASLRSSPVSYSSSASGLPR